MENIPFVSYSFYKDHDDTLLSVPLTIKTARLIAPLVFAKSWSCLTDITSGQKIGPLGSDWRSRRRCSRFP